MSVVIIGGNERMSARYEEVCQGYGCEAKIFTKEKGSIKKKIGKPDLIILFTNTVSHKMILSATAEAKKHSIRVERVHSSSVNALQQLLESKVTA